MIEYKSMYFLATVPVDAKPGDHVVFVAVSTNNTTLEVANWIYQNVTVHVVKYLGKTLVKRLVLIDGTEAIIGAIMHYNTNYVAAPTEAIGFAGT